MQAFVDPPDICLPPSQRGDELEVWYDEGWWEVTLVEMLSEEAVVWSNRYQLERRIKDLSQLRPRWELLATDAATVSLSSPRRLMRSALLRYS